MPPPVSTPTAPVIPPDRERWFVEHVQSHEPALRTWLKARFPSLTDIDDLVQEALVRVWRSNRSVEQMTNPRSYLFTIARNAATDLFRRDRVIPFEPLGVSKELMEETPAIPDAVSSVQELQVLHEAIAALPDRCRAVMTLQKIHGKSNADIAKELGVSVNTVNAQMVIGLTKCRKFLKERGILRGAARESGA